MKVAFLADQGNADGTIGGAELTMAEFATAAPASVELQLNLQSLEQPLEGVETVVIGNCASYRSDLTRDLVGKHVVWYHNDLSPHIDPKLKAWLDEHATHIFCSPLQVKRYGFGARAALDPHTHVIPPAIDLDRFTPTRQVKRNGDRDGLVSIGAWQNPMKGQTALLEYARAHGGMDVYGTGPYAPRTPPLDFKGPLELEQVPQTLWAYSTFVHLPWAVEPFGRGVVEAWAAGLKLVVNKLVGARYWLEERPEALRTASEDFWDVVCSSP